MIHPVEDITEIEKVFGMMGHLSGQMSRLISAMSYDNQDVDEYKSLVSPGTQLILAPNFRTPIVVDFILAVFPTTTTSAVIQLGPERVITIGNLAAGVFAVDTRIQLEAEDQRILTIAPAGVAHFEIMGHTAKRQADRI